MEPTGAKPHIFISYSHDDEAWKERVVSQLGVLEHEGLLSVWDDRQIDAGDDWLPDIETAISSCNVALLLISAKFLTSKFILGTEVPALLQRREQEGVRVIPVILKPCAWDEVTWLKSIQARPKDGKPLSGMSEHEADTALATLAKEIATLARRATPIATPPMAGTSSLRTQSASPLPAGAADSTSPLPPAVATQLSSPALSMWQKKLAFLQAEEAKAADAEQKFAIQQRIEECKEKIREYGGQP